MDLTYTRNGDYLFPRSPLRSRKSAHRQVRAAAKELPERTQARMVFQPAADRQTGCTSGRDRPHLHGTCRTDYESAGSARRRDRSAQSLRSDGVDQRHEQHPGKGRGSCIERIGLQVIGNASSPLWLVTGSSICISLLI